jgi:hypothetical protein
VSVETIAGQLFGKLGFVAMSVQAFGVDLVRSGDQAFELRKAEAIRSDLLRLTFALNPLPGAEPQLLMLSVRDPKGLKLKDGAIELASATSVRLEERTLTAQGKQFRATEGGEPDALGEIGGPALLLS